MKTKMKVKVEVKLKLKMVRKTEIVGKSEKKKRIYQILIQKKRKRYANQCTTKKVSLLVTVTKNVAKTAKFAKRKIQIRLTLK